jgi:hypothetical protein
MKTTISLILLTAAVAASAQPYSAANPPLLPDPKLTPGAIFTNVTIEQLTTKGYANVFNGGVRNVPESEKRAVFIEYFGAVPARPGNYEVDHLISLELGGCNSISNLWPQAYNTPFWNAHTKDRVEDRAAALVRQCLQKQGPAAAAALLKQYQTQIAVNWTNLYVKIVGPPPLVSVPILTPHQKP